MKKIFLTIAGNIGVGKTTLTKMLSQDFNWSSILEPSVENPYLEDFYKNMNKWSLHSQLYFLANRAKVHGEISKSENPVIEDRSIYEDVEIFAKNLFLQGMMDERDYGLYQMIYKEFCENLPKPNAIIYLQAKESTLLERIKNRNREEEKDIKRKYLKQLNEIYDSWTKNFSLCPIITINTDNLNIVKNQNDYKFIKEKIATELNL